MFILLDSTYLILDYDDIEKSVPETKKSLALFDLKRDRSEPLIIPWPAKSNKPNNDNNKKDIKFLCGAVSSLDDYLAVSDDHKQVAIFKATTTTGASLAFEFFRQFEVKRNAMKILFLPGKSDSVLVMDKSGDILEYPGGDEITEPVPLLGHCSMLLDFIITAEQKFIISCDRDEKIRVTHYPNTYNIETYCLGHTEFVSTVKLISPKLLLSGSGDGTVAVWDFLAGGKVIFVYDCESGNGFNGRFPENHYSNEKKHERSNYAVRSIAIDRNQNDGTFSNYLCLSYYTEPIIDLLKIDRQQPEVRLERRHRLSTFDCPPLLIGFHDHHGHDWFLWVFGGHKANSPPVQCYYCRKEPDGEKLTPCAADDQPSVVNYLANQETFGAKIKTAGNDGPNLVQSLFKHSFHQLPASESGISGDDDSDNKKSRIESPPA